MCLTTTEKWQLEAAAPHWLCMGAETAPVLHIPPQGLSCISKTFSCVYSSCPCSLCGIHSVRHRGSIHGAAVMRPCMEGGGVWEEGGGAVQLSVWVRVLLGDDASLPGVSHNRKTTN